MTGSGKVAIIGALITAGGVVGAAVVANADKWFVDKPAAAVPAPAPQPLAGAQPLPTGLGSSQDEAFGAASTALDDITRQIEESSAANIAGDWNAAGGYRFAFVQKGKAYSYYQYEGRRETGFGEGLIAGRALSHRFRTLSGEAGSCEAKLSLDGKRIDGTCRSDGGGGGWQLAIAR